MILVVLLLLIAAGLLLPAAVLRRWGYRNLTYSLSFSSDEVTEGETVTLTETVCSSKLLPLPWVKAELTTHASLVFASGQSAVSNETRFVSSFFSLRPYRRIERRWQVRCTRRGIFQVSHAVIVLSDLFGFAELSQAFPEASASLRVLPAVRHIEADTTFPQGFSGDLTRRRALLPDRFAVCGIRPYADGDPLRDICWTASARAGEPMVWQYQETAAPRLTVLLNMETRETDRDLVSDPVRFEQAVSVCAAYATAAARARIPVRFCANTMIDGRPVETVSRTGNAETLHLLRILAALPDTISGRFSSLLREVSRQDAATAILAVTVQADAQILAIAADDPRITVITVRRPPVRTGRAAVYQSPFSSEERSLTHES